MAALLADTFDGVVVLLPLHNTVVKCVHVLVQAALEDIIPARHHFRCMGIGGMGSNRQAEGVRADERCLRQGAGNLPYPRSVPDGI